MTRIGSLFTGVGGLDLAVQAVTGGTVAWHSENDPDACRVLEHRFPGVPNLGDITAVDWTAVESVDVLCGGFPCTDVSSAGKRLGLGEGTRSGLWSEFARAIAVLRPRLVVIENVRGLLSARAGRGPDAADLPPDWTEHSYALPTDEPEADADRDLGPDDEDVGGDGGGPVQLRAMGAVLGDLAELGMDARWCGLRAADIGAPHGRFRVFIVAEPAADADRRAVRQQPVPQPWGDGAPVAGLAGADVATDPTRHGRHEGWAEPTGQLRGHDAPERGAGDGATADPKSDARRVEHGDDGTAGADVTADADRDGREGIRGLEHVGRDPDGRGSADVAWGVYEPAIRRWERLTRPAPMPWVAGRNGSRRLNPAFSEWMLGLPAGWVTDVSGVGRNAALRLLGNAVQPQQAEVALRWLLADQLVGAA